MKGKKFIIRVLAIIMIGAGFLSVMEVVAGELPKAPSLKVLKVSLGFHGDKNVEKLGEVAYYDVDPETGCIQDVYDRDGKIPPTKKPPAWLVMGKDGKNILYVGSAGDLECRQGVIGIDGSPIEYWVYANGHWICVGAWDSKCLPYGTWYPRCLPDYPSCP